MANQTKSDMPKIHKHARGNYYLNHTLLGPRKSIYGATPEEVEKKYKDLKRQLGIGIKVNDNTTLGDYLLDWVDRKYRSKEIGDYAYTNYRGNIVNHINPEIGNKKLVHVMPADIKRLFIVKRIEAKSIKKEQEKHQAAKEAKSAATTPQEKAAAAELLKVVDLNLSKKKPLNGTSIHYLYRVLSAAFGDAKIDMLIETNIMEFVRPPKKAPKKKKKPVPVSGVQALFDEVRGKDHEVGTHLAVAVGMRRGEICAIGWEDYFPDELGISINKAMTQTAVAGIRIKLVKNDKDRDAFIPEGLNTIFEREIRRQAADAEILGDAYPKQNRYMTNEDEEVFINNMVRHRDGRPFTPYALSMAINASIKKAGLNTTLHGLREEFISLGYKYKADAKAIVETAGHHSEEFNRTVYQNVFDEQKKELADKVGEALYGPGEITGPAELESEKDGEITLSDD